MARLITECRFDDLLTEKDTESGDLYIEGIFIQADKPNHNDRVYPLSVMEREVQTYDEEFIQTKRAIGELNHPTETSINPERASHLVVSLTQDGTDFIGKAKILNTPQGNIVRGLLEGGVKMGVSTRGVGSVEDGRGRYKGVSVVQDDFKLITIDIVSNPSAPDAFVKGIYESMEYMVDRGVIKPCIPGTSIKVSHVMKESTKGRRRDNVEVAEKLCALLRQL